MLEPAPQERKGGTESRAHWLGDGVERGGSEEQEGHRQSLTLPPLQQWPRPLRGEAGETAGLTYALCPSGPDMQGCEQILPGAQMPRMWADWFEEQKNPTESFLPFPTQGTRPALSSLCQRILQNDICPASKAA